MAADFVPYVVSAVACALAALLIVRASPPLAWLSLTTLALQSLAVFSRAQSPDWPLALTTQAWIYFSLPPFTALLAAYGYYKIDYKLAPEWIGVGLLALTALAYTSIALLVLLFAEL